MVLGTRVDRRAGETGSEAENAIAVANAAGVCLILDAAEENIVVMRAKKMTDQARTLLKENKDAVIGLLKRLRYVGWSKVPHQRWKRVAVCDTDQAAFHRTLQHNRQFQHSENMVLPEGMIP